MSNTMITLLVIAVILVVSLVVLYFLGSKAQKQQEEQKKLLEASAQQVSMLVIDKAKMRLCDANFPDSVMNGVKKRQQKAKVYVVKAKIGPRVTSLLCEPDIFEIIPVKKEVKATVSGLYITAVKGIRGPLEAPKKKKGFMAKLRDKAAGVDTNDTKKK